MQIETDLFGTITYEASEVLHFEDGLYGFEDAKRFLLIDIQEMPYKSLQSLDFEDLAFTVTTPFAFYENYDIEIPEHVVKQLKIESLDDMDVYSILVFREPLPESTMNLKAPLIINSKNRVGKQVILNEDYPLKYKFFADTEE